MSWLNGIDSYRYYTKSLKHLVPAAIFNSYVFVNYINFGPLRSPVAMTSAFELLLKDP